MVIAGLVYTHDWEFETSDTSLTWKQPTISTRQPWISPENYDVQFERIERSLGEVQFTSKNQIVLNTETAGALERAIGYMSKQSNKDQLERIEFLLDKIFPSRHHNNLPEIALNYRDYLIAQEVLDKGTILKTLDDSEQALKAQIALKEQYLGKEITELLFKDKHAMAFYIINRRKIITDSTLTPEQKENKLSELQNTIQVNN
ncbi:hypothetical protein NBRC116188_05380 [Oceaniserpentilla sp. 4NH20-0058]|uniref:lipase secretion chaperone n=1 Tax=Oceaniserpentilla sp. 4NH20-0058 TaxID=3127660 RepID=UPI003101DB86